MVLKLKPTSLKTVMLTHLKIVDLVYLVWQMKYKSTKSSLTSTYQVLSLVPELIVLLTFVGTLLSYEFQNPRKLLKHSKNLSGFKPCKTNFFSSSLMMSGS